MKNEGGKKYVCFKTMLEKKKIDRDLNGALTDSLSSGLRFNECGKMACGPGFHFFLDPELPRCYSSGGVQTLCKTRKYKTAGFVAM